VDSANASKRERLRAYLESRRPAAIGEAEWRDLARELAPIAESRLRELVRGAGLPVEQPWAGVGQKSFAELERTLLEMAAAYGEALESGLKDRARYCRRVVITAKDHARLAARNPRTGAAKRTQKEEMVEWMLVWLGDPAMFAAWAALRKERLGLAE
jgi:hypothetical protein